MRLPRFWHATAAISGVVIAGVMAGSVPAIARPVGGGRAGTQTPADGPGLQLIAAQNRITLPITDGFVFLDPGIYVASLGAPLQLDVQRSSYTQPITVRQVIRTGDGTRTRHLPGSVLDEFSGLRQFFWLRMVNARGKTVFAQRMTFCPDSLDPQRATVDGPQTSLYPQQCAPIDPFPVGSVWGIARGWAVDPVEGVAAPGLPLPPGTYTVTESVTSQYRQLFGISARAAAATVTIQVVNAGTGSAGQPLHRGDRQAQALPSAPNVPLLADPPRSTLPDLVALPAWRISLSQTAATTSRPATAMISFGATVWNGGQGPLDVQGFRADASPVSLLISISGAAARWSAGSGPGRWASIASRAITTGTSSSSLSTGC